MNDLVLITSVINTGTKEWSYSSIRSVYTPEERYTQTLYTIESVRRYFPSSKIFLVESSQISEIYTRTFLEKTDFYLNLNEYDYVRKACLESKMKGYGEATQTKYALEYLEVHKIQFKRVFKLSGRYFLTELFNPDNFSNEQYTFKKRLHTYDNSIVISTVLYSVPRILFENYYKTICSVIQYYENIGEKGYEALFPALCKPRNEIETVGAGGRIAVTQDEIIYV